MYSIKAVSRATGLTVETLRAWERRYGAVTPQRDDAGRRVYSPEDVRRLRSLRAATRRGHPIGRLVRLSNDRLAELVWGARVSFPEAATPGELVERILVAAEQYRVVGCEEPLALATALLPPEMLITGVVGPLLREVGDRWHRGEFSIAQERLVSAGVRRYLNAALDTYARNARGSPIVLATLPGERHELGLLMCAVFCASRGCAIHYLGVELPVGEIARYSRAVSARVVALSLVMLDGLAGVPDQLRELSNETSDATAIWLGGTAAAQLATADLPPKCIVLADQEGLERKLAALEAEPALPT